jgi:hypothetical protein
MTRGVFDDVGEETGVWFGLVWWGSRKVSIYVVNLQKTTYLEAVRPPSNPMPEYFRLRFASLSMSSARYSSVKISEFAMAAPSCCPVKDHKSLWRSSGL